MPAGKDRTTILLRAGLAGAILAVTGMACASALAGAGRSLRPSAAIALRPADARAAATIASRLAQSGDDERLGALLEQYGRSALRRDPTVDDASVALASRAEGQKQRHLALRAHAYTQVLTKRNLTNQMWLLQDALARNDVDAAIRHFQVAASAARSATGILFPMIAPALGDDRFIEPMARMLAKDPIWSPSLLQTLSEGAGPARNAGHLFVRVAQLGTPIRPDIAAQMANRLERSGDFALAMEVRRSSRQPVSKAP